MKVHDLAGEFAGLRAFLFGREDPCQSQSSVPGAERLWAPKMQVF